ncbi:hypothetical protein AVEN_3495-1 [Araneus ventricosus]|uniref:Mos1 transposase HTH domain-containing protein n=1 Tax=Araneus ventricosus TaxID=182803 RepID=A0A4Y2UIB7_ARAVE|nr:hypothetical protein AVEN_3495-1 [Araneus ventricosus]
MRSTRKKWCTSWKLTPTLKYAEQYVFCGQNVSRVRRFIVRYGPHAMSRPAIVRWCQQFEDGRTDLTDRKGTTINAESYCDTLRGLRKALKNKRCGELNIGIVLLHDNARHHKARTTKGLLRSFGSEFWQHPPYSPDMAPCDF